MQFQMNFWSTFLFFSNCNNFVSCCQAHVLSSPRLLHTLRTYLPSCCPLSPSLSLLATTVSSLLPFAAAAAASLQCVCCCILFIVQCICMSHPRTPRPVCVCVCIYACSNLFIVCIFVYVLYIPRIHVYIYMQRSTNWCCSHCCFNFFVIFYWALAALSIACPSVWEGGGLPHCMAISIMHAQIIKLF